MPDGTFYSTLYLPINSPLRASIVVSLEKEPIVLLKYVINGLFFSFSTPAQVIGKFSFKSVLKHWFINLFCGPLHVQTFRRLYE